MGEEVEKSSSAVSAFCAGIFSKLRERQAALPTPTSPKLETHHQKIVRVRERGMVGSRGRVFATCFVSRARSYAFVCLLCLSDTYKCMQGKMYASAHTNRISTFGQRLSPAPGGTAAFLLPLLPLASPQGSTDSGFIPDTGSAAPATPSAIARTVALMVSLRRGAFIVS